VWEIDGHLKLIYLSEGAPVSDKNREIYGCKQAVHFSHIQLHVPLIYWHFNICFMECITCYGRISMGTIMARCCSAGHFERFRKEDGYPQDSLRYIRPTHRVARPYMRTPDSNIPQDIDVKHPRWGHKLSGRTATTFILNVDLVRVKTQRPYVTSTTYNWLPTFIVINFSTPRL
jgi:hypothetical protein